MEDDYTTRVAAAAPEVLARELVAPVVTGIRRPSRPVSARVPAATRTSSTRVPITTPVTSTPSVYAPIAADARENVSVSGDGLRYFNGIGGYNDRNEYEIRISGDTLPPVPWVNVIGNPAAGLCISENGSGATWASNSSFRLTPWHNDPVEDPTGDCIYIRDTDNGDLWTPTPEPIRETTQYTVKHGAGYTVFEHEHDEIATSLRVGLPKEDPLKISVLTITNNGGTTRRLVVTSYTEWLLGTDREKTQQHVRTKMDEDSSTMLAYSRFDPQFSQYVAFASVSDPVVAYTAARREFLGRNGAYSAPAALSRNGMTEDSGDTIDPCSAMQMRLELAPGETHQIVVLLGACVGEEEARRVVAKHRAPTAAVVALDEAAQTWRNRLDLISVKTPEPTFDLMLNYWILYQALSSPHVGPAWAVSVERGVRVP